MISDADGGEIMPKYADVEKAEAWLHREDWGTPDERWRPESEFGAMLDSLPEIETSDAAQKKPEVSISFYDKVTRYSNCTVEVLENTATGETSVGWYKTEETEEINS